LKKEKHVLKAEKKMSKEAKEDQTLQIGGRFAGE